MAAPDWSALVRNKLAARDAHVPPEWRLPESITSKVHRNANISSFTLLEEANLLTDRDRHLTEDYDATALLHAMATGELTSLEVTTAFCKRAAIAHQLINPLTEIFFEKALKRAEECDAYLSSTGKPMGPFHGLPISVKDSFMIEGEYATMGFVSYLQKPAATKNSTMVDILLDGGAVLYCKTTVPQTLFVMEGENNVFGLALNSQKLCLTPGGSSSGEGALVGFRGSPLGVGTDIGGSVRVPSLVNAKYGFKPTADRLPFSEQQEFFRPGWPGVVPSVGAHAHSARDLTLLCKNTIQVAWDRDSTVLYAPWREVQKKKNLKIGVWFGAEEMPLTPPVSRALKEASQALRAAGHDIEEITIPSEAGFLPIVETYTKSLILDTNHTVLGYVEAGGEELLPPVAETFAILGGIPPPTLDTVWDINANLDILRRVLHGIFRRFDAVICPGHRAPGAVHGTYGLPFYTAVWNLLNCPAAVAPFSKADTRIDPPQEGYDAEMFDGIACGIQIVGWTGQDEEILMATEVISEALDRHQHPKM